MKVTSLWRYPVKSMQGEQLTTADVTNVGLAGDRQWAVFDVATGLALTAKREPRLLEAFASIDNDGHVVITLPDRTAGSSDQALSTWLGRAVTLRRATHDHAATYEIAADFEREADSQLHTWQGPVGSFHDSGRTHVSLASTRSFGSWSARRFRMNIIVDASGEDGFIGETVGIGTARLSFVKAIDRCIMVTRAQPAMGNDPALERDLDVLRIINATRQSFLGVGALIHTTGAISEGDTLL